VKYTISNDRTRLTITADEREREELRNIQECGGDCQCDVSMHDYFEKLCANSELEWVFPEHTGDLTDAPMLGVCDWSNQGTSDTPSIIERWAFMDYQVRSVLEDLRDKGEAVFVGGPL